jgi:predicted XRE-type DNA-binding protein
MKKQRVVRGIPVEEGSGNVSTGLGYRDSESLLVKTQLAAKIAEILQRRALTQARAAELLGLMQRNVSALLKGRFRGISGTVGAFCSLRSRRTPEPDAPIAASYFCYTDVGKGTPKDARIQLRHRDILTSLNIYREPIRESVKQSVGALDSELLKVLDELGQESQVTIQ